MEHCASETSEIGFRDVTQLAIAGFHKKVPTPGYLKATYQLCMNGRSYRFKMAQAIHKSWGDPKHIDLSCPRARFRIVHRSD